MLSFWYWPQSEDSAWDWQTAWVRSANGALLANLMTVRDNLQAWRQRSFDLTAFRGQTIQIYFEVRNNLSRVTGMYVDDVALNVEAASSATDADRSNVMRMPTQLQLH